MATIVRCDRCLTTGCQVVQVLGHDLCNGCIGDHKAWVERGIATRSNLRVKRGTYRVFIARLLERDGCVTPDTLAEAAGVPRGPAHDALRHEKSCGRLGQDGVSRYVRPAAQEAAE